MSKNSEWGAVTYLSQSKYGKYHVDQQEVGMNNCQFKTGMAACTDDYTSINGQKTSTTGNITGVYDMNGDAWEYVMGVLNENGELKIGLSGFVAGEDANKIPDAKYYDLYTTDLNTSCTIKQECYGHALLETIGWYNDNHDDIVSSSAWFARGGASNSSFPGVFYFAIQNGDTLYYGSFRLVLASIA